MAGGVKIFFDGGLRPAPLGMELAVVVGGRVHVRRDLGLGTSMEAEWLALIEAARLVRELGLTDPVFLGDAAAVVAQAKGAARCRGICAEHRLTLASLLPSRRLRIRYIKRSQNLAGIALARGHDQGFAG